MTLTKWTRALRAAELTPPERNRAVDFFRAVAIVTVVFGHWLANVPYYDGDGLQFTKLLVNQPWTQYLTWIVQVMPIFFFVGGYSNAASWSSSQHHPEKRRIWQATRFRRLLLPITPLVVVCAVGAWIGTRMGAETEEVKNVSRAALIPVWFLAVYVMVTLVVPVSYRAWKKIGVWSIIALFAGAVLIDVIGFAGGVGWIRWVNYGFIWLAMHQMGYWWREGSCPPAAPVLLTLVGVVSLLSLVFVFGYPVAMISVPGAEVSNSRPPTIAMLAIGLIQSGIILMIAGRVSRWLQRPRRWAVVILLSQRIMTIYLWHMTALLILVALSLLANGFGLKPEPGGGLWWLTRPLWMAALLAVLFPLVAVFGGLESNSRASDGTLPGPVRATLGALLASGGLTFLALQGTASDGGLGVNLVPVIAALAGVALSAIPWRSSD